MTCEFNARFHKTKRFLAAAIVILSTSVLSAGQATDEVSPEVQQLYTQAKAAQQRGDSAAAIEKYRAMIRLAPHLAPAYNNLGMIYFNEHDYTHASEVLKRGLEIHPDMPTASAMLGMSYFQLGMDAKAEPLLRAAQHANPTDDNVEMVLAQLLVNLNKYGDATSFLNDFLARNPKNQEAWYLLGKTYLKLSEESLKKINEIDPNSIVAHEIAGEIDESMHNYDVALVEYRKAIDIDPHKPGTHMRMAKAYMQISKWESAQVEFKAELENDPYNCTARWMLANSILEANDSTEDALSQLNQSIERCPALMQARVDRARALIRLGKPSDALPDLQLAVNESPDEPSIHFLLAAVYRAQGNTVEAQREMKAYSKLQREASEAISGQAHDADAIKNAAH